MVNVSLWPTLAIVLVLNVIEFMGPWLAEHRGPMTPWNAQHIAERYSLFAIIALGEGVVGTVAALSSVQEASRGAIGMDVVLVGAAGIGLTFGMWWTYFLLPAGQILRVHRYLGFRWGYGSMVLFGAIIATGAGLHVAALALEVDAEIGVVGTVLSVAAPVGLYIIAALALYRLLTQENKPFHLWLLLGTIAVLVCAVAMAAMGVSMPLCLVVVALAPVVTVVGYETVGHRHAGEVLGTIASQTS